MLFLLWAGDVFGKDEEGTLLQMEPLKDGRLRREHGRSRNENILLGTEAQDKVVSDEEGNI
jgi:hypothetical protein